MAGRVGESGFEFAVFENEGKILCGELAIFAGSICPSKGPVWLGEAQVAEFANNGSAHSEVAEF
jgi:hypothetical protein